MRRGTGQQLPYLSPYQGTSRAPINQWFPHSIFRQNAQTATGADDCLMWVACREWDRNFRLRGMRQNARVTASLKNYPPPLATNRSYKYSSTAQVPTSRIRGSAGKYRFDMRGIIVNLCSRANLCTLLPFKRFLRRGSTSALG